MIRLLKKQSDKFLLLAFPCAFLEELLYDLSFLSVFALKKVCQNCNKSHITNRICSIETVRKLDNVNNSLTSLNRSHHYI